MVSVLADCRVAPTLKVAPEFTAKVVPAKLILPFVPDWMMAAF